MSKKDYDPNEKWYSISAIEDHDNCPRRRWLKKTAKLPVQQSAPTIIGDVGHACNERFNMADDRGLDKTGQPVNLFPEGWMSMKNRFGKDETVYTITEEEGVLLKTLIQKAITEGYLIREPGRKVEREFRHLVHQDGEHIIKLIGFIDLDNPNEVLDYKFVKNMNYAMSVKPNAKRAIKKSTQMMTYAVVRYIEGHKGNLHLSLLYFIKDFDNPQIQKRSIEVTELEVKQFYVDNTLPSMKKMLEIDTKFPQHKVMEWAKVPGPNDPQQECNRHYGKQCPFLGICTETFSIQQYLTVFGMSINQLIGNHVNLGVSTMTANSLVNLCHKEVAAIGTAIPAAAIPAAAIPAAAVPAAAIPVAQPVAQPVAGQQTAPWYNMYQGADCMACKGNPVRGYNPTMQPCGICDARNQLEDKPISDDYTVTSDVNGILVFTLKGQATAVQAVAEPVVKTVEAVAEVIPAAVAEVVPNALDSILGNTSTAELPVAVPAASPVAAAAVAEGSPAAVVQPVAEKPLTAAEAAYIPEPVATGTFDMMIGCAPIKGTINTVNADTILSDALHTISVAAQKPIAEIEHFALLQAIDASIAEIVEFLKFKKDYVVCFPSTKGSAMDRLVEGLRIHANTVIAPIGL